MAWSNGLIYVGDIGKKMRFDSKIDLTGYQEAKIFVNTPSGVMEWTEVTVCSGETEYDETAGLSIIEYITDEYDYTIMGTYTGIIYVKFSATSIHRGEPVKWIVYDPFEPD